MESGRDSDPADTGARRLHRPRELRFGRVNRRMTAYVKSRITVSLKPHPCRPSVPDVALGLYPPMAVDTDEALG